MDAGQGRTRNFSVLDIGCCQGGASRGYELAGLSRIVGIDIEEQPRYPYEFVLGDGLKMLEDADFVGQFDFIHASWHCQFYLPGNLKKPGAPDDIPMGRDLLNATGKPWVMENVITAPLRKEHSIVLCANTFGLRTYRHRRFEYSAGLRLKAPKHLPHLKPTSTSNEVTKWNAGWHMSVTGGYKTNGGKPWPYGVGTMGIDWMNRYGCSQAVPPVYTEWIGKQVLQQLGGESE